MNDFTYYAPTAYTFGRDAEKQAGTLSVRYLGNKVLIVIGGGSVRRSGLLDIVTASLSDAGVAYGILEGIRPNPVDGPVRQGIEIVREGKFTGLLAVGGGSVIDTAKAIALGALYDGDFWDFYCGKAKAERALPVGVVLTIPAAGSEGSGNSVITLEAEGRKISLRTDHVIRPRFALLNPEWTFTLPQQQTAAGIADMMAHIFERYFSPTEDVEVTDRVSEGVLRAIMAEAPKVMANPKDYQARANIMWCGTLAHNGVCGCGRTEDWSSHAMEHEISALYGVTHGAGLAVVFPAFMTYMAMHKPWRITQMARRVFDVDICNDVAAATEGIRRLRAFWRSLGLPLTFSDLNIDNPDIDTMVTKLHQNKGTLRGTYMPLDCNATREIYQLMK